MKKFVKLIAIVLAICLLAFVFVACDDKDKAEEEVLEVSDPRRIEPLMQMLSSEQTNGELVGNMDVHIIYSIRT